MNKLSRNLVSISLVLLGLAICGGLWLVWQTIAESRALERQNRELQASLEASRIRVENFCEYPSDVLCRVDERSGTVAGALPGALPGLEELAGTSEPQKTTLTPVESASASPSKALENVKKVAQAQAAVSKASEKQPSSIQEVQVPAMPKLENKALPVASAPEKTAAPKADIPHAKAAKTASRQEPTKDKDSVQSAKPEAVQAAPLAPVVKKGDDKKAKKPAEKAAPALVTVEENPAVPAETVYTQEVSGKLSDSVISKTAKNVSKAPQKSVRPHSKKQNDVRQSWSRIDQDGDIFVFTLTGAGDKVNARGKLQSSPLRYELVLDGLFHVKAHTDISHRLVKSIRTKTWDGKTIIVFLLKSKPYKSSLHKQDNRTVSLRIR